MKAVDDKPDSRSTVQLIAIELSKAYLYRALRCKDSDSDSIYCLANVYLAVLYYVTGQYQTAIDHFKLVTRSQDHSQCSSHVVQGELLPKIDDDIDNVLGLSVFYQYVRTAALDRQAAKVTTYNSAFTTELFAHFVLLRCRSAEKCQELNLRYMPSPASEIQRYLECFYECSDMFITDVLAFSLMRRTIFAAYDRGLPLTRDQTKPLILPQLDTSELVELLQQLAVKYLTEFRHLEVQKFGSPVDGIVNPTTDFEALYAYKRGEYWQCLRLSVQTVHKLMIDDLTMPLIIAYPDFIQLMDDNIASLIGLTLIVNGTNRKYLKDSALPQQSLMLYLMSQCQMKLHHSATSLVPTLDNVEIARRKLVCRLFTLDQLLLTLTQCTIRSYIRHFGIFV